MPFQLALHDAAGTSASPDFHGAVSILPLFVVFLKLRLFCCVCSFNIRTRECRSAQLSASDRREARSRLELCVILAVSLDSVSLSSFITALHLTENIYVVMIG